MTDQKRDQSRRSPQETCKICGSYGELTVDPRGRVLEYLACGEDEYRSILRIDLARYRRETGDTGFTDLDILRVGYWHLEHGQLAYEEPLADALTGAAWDASDDDIAACPILTRTNAVYAPVITGAL